MLEDNSKVIAYDWNYTTYNGTPMTLMCVHCFEREGEDLESELNRMRHRNDPSYTNYRIMTFSEFYDEDRRMTLGRPVYEIDEQTFDNMLNVLPPLKWVNRPCKSKGVSVNEFCMSEFDHAQYTTQYARAYVDGKTRYYGATVDYYDESTWIHNRI